MERNYPFFSIIIPTYNRPDQLATCLKALSLLKYPADRYEVIVVDDGSKIPPTKAVTAVQDSLPAILLKQSHAGPAAARNLGAARARGAFLAFIDDDCIPDPAWLITFAGHFEKSAEQAVGGHVVNVLRQNPFSNASQAILDIVYDAYQGEPCDGWFFSTNNLSLPAKGFHNLGGFDSAFRTSEDREFCDRWRFAGYRLTYAPEALVYHAHALTLRSFWRQHFNYGRGAFRFHQKRAQRGAGYFKPEMMFYGRVVRFVCRLFATERWERAALFTTLMIIWQIANLLGFTWQAITCLSVRSRAGKARP